MIVGEVCNVTFISWHMPLWVSHLVYSNIYYELCLLAAVQCYATSLFWIVSLKTTLFTVLIRISAHLRISTHLE